MENTTESEENGTDYWDSEMAPEWSEMMDSSKGVVAILYMSIFLIALTGNALVIPTVLHQQHTRSVTNIMLLNLSFADFLLVLICMPVTLIGHICQNFIFPTFICPVAFFFQGTFKLDARYEFSRIFLS